jgi:signal transduction histidine kinase
LAEVQNRITEYLPAINRAKNDLTTDTVLGIQLTVLLLTGQPESVVRYGKVLSEPAYREYCFASPLGYVTYCTFKAQCLYILEQTEAALSILESIQPALGSIFGFTASLEYNFYHSLVLLAQFDKVADSQREEYLKTITANQAQLKKWADNCPDNFLHRWLLVEAERARVNGHNFEAVELYDSAIELAGQYEFIQNQALANELAAKFWLQKDKPKIAKLYLQEACHGYTVWGATRKVADLLETYPLLFLKTTTSTVITSQPSPQSTVYATSMPVATMIGQSAEQVLDLTTLMKVSQALSGEIWLNRLLERLMHTVIENAGAQRGSLVLKQEEDWVIEAQGASYQDSVTVLQSLPLAGHLPLSVINYVMRTKQPVVVANAQTESLYRADDYIRTQQVKSLLCLPIVYQQKLVGMIYLENNLATGIFTPNRLQMLTLLTSQIAISLENARFVVELDQARQAEAQARQVIEAANYTKTAFLANVTHELRTPLNGILGYTQLLLLDSQLTTEQQDSVKVIHRCGEHLLTLVSDILEISKLQTAQLELQPTDLYLSKFLTHLVAVFRDQAQLNGLTFRYEPATGLPGGIVADEKRLRQILLHLLSNAVKFTHRHGHITFQVQSEPLPDLPGWYHFHFIITDTGCGIAASDLERIFVPFEQVSDWRQKSAGAGLGLSLTKQLVELMGGQLEVSSQVGQGSIFTVHLALVESAEWQGVMSAELRSAMEETSRPLVAELDTPLQGPSAEKAAELFEMAQLGDFGGILELVTQLEQEDAELRPFGEKVRKLAKNYQDELICELVQQFMADQH